jgi:hypothetical protein
VRASAARSNASFAAWKTPTSTRSCSVSVDSSTLIRPASSCYRVAAGVPMLGALLQQLFGFLEALGLSAAAFADGSVRRIGLIRRAPTALRLAEIHVLEVDGPSVDAHQPHRTALGSAALGWTARVEDLKLAARLMLGHMAVAEDHRVGLRKRSP